VRFECCCLTASVRIYKRIDDGIFKLLHQREYGTAGLRSSSCLLQGISPPQACGGFVMRTHRASTRQQHDE